MSDLTVIAERLRQRREAARAAATAPGEAPGAPFAVGARVFDAVTGLDGTITAAGPAPGLARGTVAIALDDGRAVARVIGELIRRPSRG